MSTSLLILVETQAVPQAVNLHHLLDEKTYLVNMKTNTSPYGADARKNKAFPDCLVDDHWLFWFA